MLAGALVLAASLQQSAPVGAAETVRVHFSTPGNKIHAKLWAKRPADSSYAFICASPCTAELAAGTALRATIDDHEDEPHDFVLTTERGKDVDFIARRGGRGALAGGIVLTSIGGLTAVIGILLTAVSFLDIRDEQAIRTAGLITLGIGAGMTIGGVSMISGRTYEPVVKQVPHENSRFTSVPLPTVAQPFSLTVTF